MDRLQELEEHAREVGFDLFGVAPAAPPREGARFEAWLEAGHHADMDWLARNRDRILDPRLTLPEARSVVVLGLGHSREPVELPGGGRVARYAAGRDYHNVMGRMLRKLARRLADAGFTGPARQIVDAGPLLERSHAAQAGLGFQSKAANLLHPEFGPWFFLAELLIAEELEPTNAPTYGSCGTCTACLDACPTDALLQPGVLDSARCISYQTIENKGPIPPEMHESIGEWVFGCDICSEVCPWGNDAPDLSERFGLHDALRDRPLITWLEDPVPFKERYQGSPLQRPKRAGLARNAAIVLGNIGDSSSQGVLLRALSFDPDALVREAAGHSLARAFGEDVETQRALEEASSAEQDARVQRELLAAREHCD
ncbi:MAG: tRNA epoxyqueuosine(34) reductase QueG [Planctomycetes bacterium]|nr:tRNA epoxyqueuosine(34) reductase QueG [Planctomycetota bacterium]